MNNKQFKFYALTIFLGFLIGISLILIVEVSLHYIEIPSFTNSDYRVFVDVEPIKNSKLEKINSKFSLPIHLPPEIHVNDGKTFHYYEPDKLDFSKKFPSGFFLQDENIGLRIAPNRVYDGQMSLRDGTLIYRTKYSIDQWGHRIVLDQPENLDKFLFFLGCSYTFGEGVSDTENFPYLVSTLEHTHRVYNISRSGFGPTHLAALTNSDTFGEGVKEKAGVGVYIFMNSHIQRTIGTMTYFKEGALTPYFYLNSNGDLVRDKFLSDGRPFINFIYKYLFESKIVKLFNMDFPLEVSENHFKLIAKVIQSIQLGFHKHFPESKFYVVGYPMNKMFKPIIPYLEKFEIPYLDYSDVDPNKYIEGPPVIEYEGHPSKFLHKFFAEQLVRDLDLN